MDHPLLIPTLSFAARGVDLIALAALVVHVVARKRNIPVAEHAQSTAGICVILLALIGALDAFL
jgi:hypothetical protein